MEQRGQKIKNKENMMQRLSYNQTGAPEGKNKEKRDRQYLQR